MPNWIDLVHSCEAEKLHLSGAIQPWGALLRVDAVSHVVSHASENVAALLGLAAADLIGKPFTVVEGLSVCLNFNGSRDGDAQCFYGLRMGNHTSLDVRVIAHQSAWLFELEPTVDEPHSVDLASLQRPLLQAPNQKEDLQTYGQTLLEGLWMLSCFDRIMIYRFHEDWSGEVVAEKTAAALGSYLNLRFPASDIPQIARDLYLINPCRHIPNAAAQSVPVLGQDDCPIDLTYADLRSVSPVHLQYLSNMGVGASFSIPIRVAGKLWGLIACHHLHARSFSLMRRMACISLVSTYSIGLTAYVASRRMQLIDRLDRRVDGVLEAIARHPDPLDGVESSGEAIMQTLSAEGFAMAMGDEVVSMGESPELDQIAVLDAWFMNETEDTLCGLENLSGVFPDAFDPSTVACGAMCIKAFSPRSGPVRFYWFRAEEPYEVAWAGNPDKPMVENAGALQLSPRRSFEKWVEKRTGYCRPWTNEDRMIAAKFRNQLLRWL